MERKAKIFMNNGSQRKGAMTVFFIRPSTAYYLDLQTILMLAWMNYGAVKDG